MKAMLEKLNDQAEEILKVHRIPNIASKNEVKYKKKSSKSNQVEEVGSTSTILTIYGKYFNIREKTFNLNKVIEEIHNSLGSSRQTDDEHIELDCEKEALLRY